MKPDLAILYWFYKEPKITKNHLELLRKHNPGRKVYGLFGGNANEADKYRELLGDMLDDFWVYPGTYGVEPYEKWVHGDLLLLDWYDQRGRDLVWESIAITQWDMAIFDDLLNILPGLKKDQVYFSGYRELNETTENRWKWTDPNLKYSDEYRKFCDFISNKYGVQKPYKACLYMLEILTRPFFDNFLKLENKKLGFLEYKDPTLAHAWGLEIYEQDLGVFWSDWYTRDTAAMIAVGGISVEDDFIIKQLENNDGWRIFHPNHTLWEI